jgi:chemotaxis protein MotB
MIIVEGHTDSIPIRGGGQYASNWELSTARATQVLRWMVEARGLPSVRFSAAGYADTHPRVANDTSAHRAENRRVEIVVLAAENQVSGGN